MLTEVSFFYFCDDVCRNSERMSDAVAGVTCFAIETAEAEAGKISGSVLAT